MKTLEALKSTFKDKKVTLMGLGLLGRGIGDAKFFAKCGAELTVTDLKSKKELSESVNKLKGYDNISFVLGKHTMEDFINADIIIKGNNVPLGNKYIKAAQDSGVRVTMSVALFTKYAQELGVTVVGVTGTRGKTTVTNMIYQALQQSRQEPPREYSLGGSWRDCNVYLGGNIRGMSTLSLASKIKKGDIVVLELDSWILQGFGYEKLSPHIAVFTNFYPDHLNYYKSMDEYFADKANIFKYQKLKNGDTLIVGDSAQERVVAYKSPVEPLDIVPIPQEWELKVPGVHNRENAALAREALQALGLTDVDIRESLEQFSGVEGRLEYMGEFTKDNKKIKIYNDNNATTPEAAIAGINALASRQGTPGDNENHIILIAGGTDKGTELKEVAKIIEEKCKAVHLLEGSGTDKLIPLLKNPKVHKRFADTVQAALAAARAGDTILFSPIFSSFGKEFVNEYDRNDKFKKIIKEYYDN
ncbi:MAG: UDP-N-acetylmuramoyl-L-alanine--D-glutamate ligase [Candidatus Pacebacteria bacterium]|nr:UDP-N-acetylmuramoyl-L-alanine--D-glutamate ligase [Candidatus Paceibacterota bacterium]